jgi:hypothetical protein
MAHLLYGFRDLVNISPNNISIDISSLLLDDSYLKKLSPNRYNFYVKFIEGLSNPYVLEKFLYKTKEAKDYKVALNQKVAKLANLIKRLNNNFDTTDKNKIIENISNVIKGKFKIDDVNMNKITNLLSTKIDGGAGEADAAEKQKEKLALINEEEKYIRDHHINKGPEPMKNFLNKINAITPDLVAKAPPSNIEDIIESDVMADNDKSKEKDYGKNSENIKKIKTIYEKYKDGLSPDTLKITFIDRLIFIGITFLIRYVSLMIISWGLDTNIIKDFQRAFFIYCIIYLLFFIFMAMIVNVIVYYPVLEIFTSSDIISLPNMFYYFYIYTNGSTRLIIHSIIIIILLYIPYVINMDKINFDWLQQPDKNISYDYEKKKKIYDSISLFSFIIWILTSVIALKF